MLKILAHVLKVLAHVLKILEHVLKILAHVLKILAHVLKILAHVLKILAPPPHDDRHQHAITYTHSAQSYNGSVHYLAITWAPNRAGSTVRYSRDKLAPALT